MGEGRGGEGGGREERGGKGRREGGRQGEAVVNSHVIDFSSKESKRKMREGGRGVTIERWKEEDEQAPHLYHDVLSRKSDSVHPFGEHQ